MSTRQQRRRQSRRGGPQQPSGRSTRLLYLLIGGGALVAVAVAVVVFAAIGRDSFPDSDVPVVALKESGSAQTPVDVKPSPASTKEQSTPKISQVILEEFGDFQCSHCMQFALGMGKQLKEDFVSTGQIRFVFRHFPFLGEESFRAAEATECAADQNKFWEFHDTVFENWKGVNEGRFSDDNLKGFASLLQLDRAAFDSCLDSEKYRGKVEADLRLGERLGVYSTPTLFVNRRKVEPASYDELARIIESAIAAAQ